MPKKNDKEKKLEALAKTKFDVAKEANAIMLKAFNDTQKELNALLKSNNLWYSDGDLIKDNDELHTVADRNADQMILDHFNTICDDMFNHVVEDQLWTKDDIMSK